MTDREGTVTFPLW